MARKRIQVSSLAHPSQSERSAILDFHNRNFPSSKWSERSFKKYLVDTPHHPVCIAIRSEKTFAGIAIGRFSTNSRTSLNLATLLISRRCRGKGYGDVLMRKFLESSASIPFLKKIHLHFRDSNSQIKNFYKRFGFEKHRVCGKYSNGEKKHYMETSIKSIRAYLKDS